MNVWASGNDRITFDDNTNKYQLVIDDKAKMDITVQGDNCVIAFRGHGTILSDGDLRIHLDENQVGAPNTSSKLKVFSGSNFEVFSVNERGELDLNGGSITTRQVTAGAGGTGTDNTLTLGKGVDSSGRGRVAIRNQPEYSADAGEIHNPAKAGILELYDERGRNYFLWVDSTGKLRISGTDPGEEDLSGTIVGTQS